jgi:glutathione peroxidase
MASPECNADMKTAYDFSFSGLDGAPLPLAQFRGRVLLVVNTASECGFTTQFDGLEALWRARRNDGLTVLGVPCNDFGGQEPGSAEEIGAFCQKNFGVTFPLTEKCVVKGAGAHPFYVWAGGKAGLMGRPKWNFHKYLFGRDGRFIDWFSSRTTPMGPKVTAAVTAALTVPA